jgi:hypothetical protein
MIAEVFRSPNNVACIAKSIISAARLHMQLYLGDHGEK